VDASRADQGLASRLGGFVVTAVEALRAALGLDGETNDSLHVFMRYEGRLRPVMCNDHATGNACSSLSLAHG
jgi:hypothetical protein